LRARDVHLKVRLIDSAQNIIRIEQSMGRKDRNVMFSPNPALPVFPVDGPKPYNGTRSPVASFKATTLEDRP
jgi:hypothetical protein